MSECRVLPKLQAIGAAKVLIASAISVFGLTSPASASDYEESLTLQGVTFSVSATQSGGKSKLSITPSGLKAVNDAVTHDIDGRVVRAEVADIDANGDPEIYVFTATTGDNVGGIIAYSTNNKKSMSQIYRVPRRIARLGPSLSFPSMQST